MTPAEWALIAAIVTKLVENSNLITDVVDLFESKGEDVTTLRANLETALAKQKQDIEGL